VVNFESVAVTVTVYSYPGNVSVLADEISLVQHTRHCLNRFRNSAWNLSWNQSDRVFKKWYAWKN